VGYSIANYRKRDAEGLMRDLPVLRPGDEIILHTISSGQKLQPVSRNAVVSDVFKSEMSEYDSQYVYVPLDWLQQLRMMPNHATSIQIKLTDYQEADKVVKVLSRMFSHDYGYHVETWEDKQGPLLAAIGIEKRLLNVLLFLIVGVAGFGILAIFAMIVAEKKRDIGILKALGASNGGILKIFIGYALLLGLVGCGLGTLLGLEITLHVNDIEKVLAQLTGHEIFNRSIYYFDEIPTDIQAWSVILVNVGAVAIAVIFSVLPALRAALLHPVQALRYE
jgi:lipoprotein-releasing system permease protein